jgi:hypothetical protein
MSNNPTPVLAHIGEGVLDLGNGATVPISNTPMPVIYFDGAPSLSHLNGIIGVTLVVTGNVPNGASGIIQCASVVAHLKCNIPAAAALKGALESALLLAKPVENSDSKAN